MCLIKKCHKAMNKKNRSILKALSMVSQFGINMLVPIIICVFIGMKLDAVFGTNFLVVVMFFIGALAGFTNIMRMAREIYKDDDKRARKH